MLFRQTDLERLLNRWWTITT